jgi:diadenosine tetraphosphate (Ap4A) HIT family hydrolase
MTESEVCPLCSAISQAEPQEVAFENQWWIALTLLDVPGWLRVMTKRHAEGPWDLTQDEAIALGPVLRVLSRAVKDATGAERIHTVSFGEGALHYHYGLLPRRRQETPMFSGAPLLERSKSTVDPVAARNIAAQIHTACIGS